MLPQAAAEGLACRGIFVLHPLVSSLASSFASLAAKMPLGAVLCSVPPRANPNSSTVMNLKPSFLLAIVLFLSLGIRSIAASPDLIVSSIVVSPTTIVAGSPAIVALKVENAGKGPAGESVTRLRLNQASARPITSTGFLADAVIPPLAAGASYSTNLNVEISDPTVLGTYFVWAIADNLSQLTQSGGDNDFTRSGAITVSPRQLVLTQLAPFGEVQIGLSITNEFEVQHRSETPAATGTVDATPPFYVVSGSPFTVADGSAAKVRVRFSPVAESSVAGTITVNGPGIPTGAIAFTASGTGVNQPDRGTIFLNATLDGAAWNGPVGYSFSGPVIFSGNNCPAYFQNRPQGEYALAYSSGGPPGATLSSITPYAAQTLVGAGSTTYTLNFKAVKAVSVAIPNGGEKWNSGTRQTIAWSFGGGTAPAAGFKAAYSIDGGLSYQNIPNVLTGTDRFADWDIPSGVSSSQVRVRIQAFDADGKLLSEDASDANLIIAIDGFSLKFPLDGLTPYTADISSVFDHSMTDRFTSNGEVIAFTMEKGNVVDTLEGESSPGSGLFSFKKPLGTPSDQTAFRINGHYVGTQLTKSGTINYDGHPGYDYKIDANTDVFAAHAGIVVTNDTMDTTGAGNYVRVEDADAGYQTQYLHLSEVAVAIGEYVRKGQRIGKSGGTAGNGSKVSPHLHFEVKKRVGTNWVSVDPYGWDGTPDSDPYFQLTGVRNTILWLDAKPSPISTAKLILLAPSMESTVSAGMFTLTGIASSPASGISSVTVNGVLANTSVLGNSGVVGWNQSVNLNPGLNSFEVVVRDKSAEQKPLVFTHSVTYDPSASDRPISQPAVIFSGPERNLRLKLNGTNVLFSCNLWLNASIKSVPKNGGEVRDIAVAPSSPPTQHQFGNFEFWGDKLIAETDGYYLVVVPFQNGQTAAAVVTWGEEGGVPIPLVSGVNGSFGMSRGTIFGLGGGRLAYRSYGGNSLTTFAWLPASFGDRIESYTFNRILMSLPEPYPVDSAAWDGTRLYFYDSYHQKVFHYVNNPGYGQVNALPLGGDGSDSSIFLDAERVFVNRHGGIECCQKDGTGKTTLVSKAGVKGWCSDGQVVFYTDGTFVKAVPVTGGASVTLVNFGESTPTSLVADERHFYWANLAGQIFKAIKPNVPTLEMVRLDQRAAMTWSTNSPGFVLEWSSDATTWNVEPNSPSRLGDKHLLLIDASLGQRLFRLRKATSLNP